MQAGVKGAFTGAMFGAIGGYYGNNWTSSRVAANSLAGGVSSRASGGKFVDGLKISLAMSMMRMGWEYTKKATDAYKYTACSEGSNSCEYNEWGELLTDGTRGADYKLGYSERDNNWITSSGMGAEGRGTHMYSVDSYVGRFVNQVSKTHDWLNSDFSRNFGFYGYSYDSGLWIGASEAYNTIFQFYSFAGMLPAGVYTAGAMSASLPVDAINNLSKNYKE